MEQYYSYESQDSPGVEANARLILPTHPSCTTYNLTITRDRLGKKNKKTRIKTSATAVSTPAHKYSIYFLKAK